VTTEHPTVVQDSSGARYPLGAVLGRGGQGTVLQVRGRDLAVKLTSAATEPARRRVQEEIARVKRLPLEGLKVARPLRALAAPHVGYVMELMTGMEPLQGLVKVPKEHAADFAPWYLQSGSLLRRLRLLAHGADLLVALHGRGLVYGDLSPHNVFVSCHHDSHEVWLIDCDNLSPGVRQRAIYTPGYAVPELFRGHGCDSLTDAWSLATIAFRTLCVLHPFVGDAVHDGEPQLEERAFRGELPWVDDACGDNAASRGLPRDMVLTPQLRALAQECFGTSRMDRLQRPGAAAWADKLHRGADQVLVCPGCGSSYYLLSRACPWCGDPRPAFATVSVYLRDPALDDARRNPFQLVARQAGRPSPVMRLVVQAGRKTPLGDRVLRGEGAGLLQLEAEIEGTTLHLRGQPGCAWELVQRGWSSIGLDGRSQHLDLSSGRSPFWLLPVERPGLHRALAFEVWPGVQP